MTNHDRADMLIKTIKIWQFLQHVDDLVDDGDPSAVTIVDDFFSRYDLSLTDAKKYGVLPWAQLKTTLSILLITLCFARKQDWNSAGMKSLPEYDLHCTGKRAPGTRDISRVIQIIRNAAAHAFDSQDNISFPHPQNGVVSFQEKNRGTITAEITFRTPEGFVDFLKDYIRAIQKMAI